MTTLVAERAEVAASATRAPQAAAVPGDAQVSFCGVQKSYDGQTLVVRSLDLHIRRGEFLSLLGPSGSGKTTTLMMLAGFESPTAGEILLDGRPITRTPPHKRNFGMVFQNYALFPHMTVAANVAYPLTVRRVPRDEIARRVQQALAMVQLCGKDDRYPAQLSGGQQQRVALARALVFDPQLVLMDEPLGALDKQLREHMQIELKALHQRLGVTFVYVTHDQGEALTMSDRVAVFNDGEIQMIDAVERLYEEPSNRFVAGFIGDSTVLQGTAGATDATGRRELILPDGRRLLGVDVNGVGAGQPLTASIRPERIEALALTQVSAGGMDTVNVLQASVIDVLYFGDHLRLRCELPGQPEATVKLPLSGNWHPQPGQKVWLRLAPQYLRLYA
jgi:putative spermidine/putrescine transport system ATP-binding protein